MSILPYNAAALRLAQTYIHQGKLVGFPTETVYALAADATNDRAVAAVYAAKQREKSKPLSLLVRDIDQIRALCQMTPQAERLLAAFSPGPLTLVLPLKPNHGLSSLLNAAIQTIGVRIPNHPIAQGLLRAVAVPLVGTSANVSGEAEALSAQAMVEALGEAVQLVIDGGTATLGVASTVVKLEGNSFTLLREGSISWEEIASIATPTTRLAG